MPEHSQTDSASPDHGSLLPRLYSARESRTVSFETREDEQRGEELKTHLSRRRSNSSVNASVPASHEDREQHGVPQDLDRVPREVLGSRHEARIVDQGRELLEVHGGLSLESGKGLRSGGVEVGQKEGRCWEVRSSPGSEGGRGSLRDTNNRQEETWVSEGFAQSRRQEGAGRGGESGSARARSVIGERRTSPVAELASARRSLPSRKARVSPSWTQVTGAPLAPRTGWKPSSEGGRSDRYS